MNLLSSQEMKRRKREVKEMTVHSALQHYKRKGNIRYREHQKAVKFNLLFKKLSSLTGATEHVQKELGVYMLPLKCCVPVGLLTSPFPLYLSHLIAFILINQHVMLQWN